MPVLGFRCILESRLGLVWYYTKGFGRAGQSERDGFHCCFSLCHFLRAPALTDQVRGLAEDEGCGWEDLHRGPNHWHAWWGPHRGRIGCTWCLSSWTNNWTGDDDNVMMTYNGAMVVCRWHFLDAGSWRRKHRVFSSDNRGLWQKEEETSWRPDKVNNGQNCFHDQGFLVKFCSDAFGLKSNPGQVLLALGRQLHLWQEKKTGFS